MEDFLDTVCTPSWNDQLDRGRSFAEGVAELVERFPDELCRRFDLRPG